VNRLLNVGIDNQARPIKKGLSSNHGKTHELRNEIVTELNPITGAKVAQNQTLSPREMAETGG
jgi:hypothetical protein